MDDLDVKDVPLPLLRAGVTVISQDAHLFSGNVREAVDPRGQVLLYRAVGLLVQVLL